MKRRVKLKNCPPGLFEFEGELFLKTEYGTEKCDKDMGVYVSSVAYCVESGENFAGGVSSLFKRENLLVRPIDYNKAVARLLQKGKWKDGIVHDGDYERTGVVCSICGEEQDYETDYCPGCGTKMG